MVLVVTLQDRKNGDYVDVVDSLEPQLFQLRLVDLLEPLILPSGADFVRSAAGPAVGPGIKPAVLGLEQIFLVKAVGNRIGRRGVVVAHDVIPQSFGPADQLPELLLTAQPGVRRENLRKTAVVAAVIPPYQAELRTPDPAGVQRLRNPPRLRKGAGHVHGRFRLRRLVLHGAWGRLPPHPDADGNALCAPLEPWVRLHPLLQGHTAPCGQLVPAVFPRHGAVTPIPQEVIFHPDVLLRRIPVYEKAGVGSVTPVLYGEDHAEIQPHPGDDAQDAVFAAVPPIARHCGKAAAHLPVLSGGEPGEQRPIHIHVRNKVPRVPGFCGEIVVQKIDIRRLFPHPLLGQGADLHVPVLRKQYVHDFFPPVLVYNPRLHLSPPLALLPSL